MGHRIGAGVKMSFSLSYSSVPLEIISSALISGESNRWEYTVRIVELKQATMDFEDYNFDLGTRSNV